MLAAAVNVSLRGPGRPSRGLLPYFERMNLTQWIEERADEQLLALVFSHYFSLTFYGHVIALYAVAKAGAISCIKTHRSYLHSCIINIHGKRMGGGVNELLVVPIYYNSGRSSLITQLSFGGTVFLRERFDVAEALATIQSERIACLALAPQQCEELLNHPELDRYDKSSLRVLRKAGLPFQKRSVQAIIER